MKSNVFALEPCNAHMWEIDQDLMGQQRDFFARSASCMVRLEMGGREKDREAGGKGSFLYQGHMA